MATPITKMSIFVASVQNAAEEAFRPVQSVPTFPVGLLAAAFEYECRCNEDCGTQQVMTKELVDNLFTEYEDTASEQAFWEANFPVCFAIINSACERGF